MNDDAKGNSSRPREPESPSMPLQRTIHVVYRGGQLVPLEPLPLPDGIPIVMQLAVRVSSTPAQNAEQSWQLVPQLELKTVEAICEDGAIRLVSPVDLPENTPIRLSMIWQLAMLATPGINSQSIAQRPVPLPNLATGTPIIQPHLNDNEAAFPPAQPQSDSTTLVDGHSSDIAVVEPAYDQSDSAPAANFSGQQSDRARGALDRIRAVRIDIPHVDWKGLRAKFTRPLSRSEEAIAASGSLIDGGAKSGDASGDAAMQSGMTQPHSATQSRAGLLAGLSAAHLRWLSIAGIMLAIILVYGGQVVLLRTEAHSPREGLMQTLAGSLLIAGALLFGVLARGAVAALPRLEFPQERVSQPALAWRNRWTLGWLAAAIAIAAATAREFAIAGESPIVVTSWLISILALLIAQMWGIRLKRPSIAPQERLYLAALAVVLVVALITRVYKLTTLPYNVDGDFTAVGLQARALAIGQQRHIFTYGWAAVPILGYLPPWLTMTLFGTGLVGLNASGVVEGLFIIAGVYLLGRDLFHPRVGLIAAALLTVSYAHLAASRQSSYIDPVVFLLYAIYFLLIGLREGRGWAIVASGLLTTLCIQMYFSGRMVVFIVGFILLYLLLLRRPWLRAYWWAAALWVLAVLITLGPMLVVFARDLNTFMGRAGSVFVLNPEIIKHEQNGYQVQTVPALLLQQARRTALMFHYYGDNSSQFAIARPFLDPITAPVFTLGVGYALFHWRRLPYALTLAWVVLTMVIGCFLTANPPFWTRLMVLLPPTALLAAVTFNLLYEPIAGWLERFGGHARPIMPITLALLITVVGVLNWNTYVQAKGAFATSLTRMGRYLDDQPPMTRGYLISNDFQYRTREFEFLAPGRLVGNLTPKDVERDIASVGRPTLLILTQEQSTLLDRLRQRFPEGSAETHSGNRPDEVAFYVFRLP